MKAQSLQYAKNANFEAKMNPKMPTSKKRKLLYSFWHSARWPQWLQHIKLFQI